MATGRSRSKTSDVTPSASVARTATAIGQGPAACPESGGVDAFGPATAGPSHIASMAMASPVRHPERVVPISPL